MWGANSSSFGARLDEPLPNVCRAELCALSVPPPGNNGNTYVLVTIRELDITELPVFYRGLHHAEQGNTYPLEVRPGLHVHAPILPIASVDRLSVTICSPDGTPLPGACLPISLLLRITVTPRLEVLAWQDLKLAPVQEKLVMLDMDFALARQGDTYCFQARLPGHQPLFDVSFVRLVGLRMPPLFVRPRTWEPYVELHLQELGIRWLVQHTWYFTDHDMVDWSVLPDHHAASVQPPRTLPGKLTVNLSSRMKTGVFHPVTSSETCDRSTCCILLHVTSRRVPA